MANLTISVDDETLKRARIRAIERGESVNRVLAQHLRAYANSNGDSLEAQQRETAEALLAHAQQIGKGSGAKFNRGEIYESRLGNFTS